MENESKQMKQKEEPVVLASEDRIEAKIDRDLRDSFPASDPPGWVLGVKRRNPAPEEKNTSPSSAPADDTKSD